MKRGGEKRKEKDAGVRGRRRIESRRKSSQQNEGKIDIRL